MIWGSAIFFLVLSVQEHALCSRLAHLGPFSFLMVSWQNDVRRLCGSISGDRKHPLSGKQVPDGESGHGRWGKHRGTEPLRVRARWPFPLCFLDLFVPALQGSSLGGIGCILEAPCSHRISHPKSCLSSAFRKPYFFSLRSVTSRKEGPSD